MLFVEGVIEEVDVLLVHFVLRELQSLAEFSNLSNSLVALYLQGGQDCSVFLRRNQSLRS